MSERARVLLVEDDPGNRRATKKFLESLGHEVVDVGSGRAALEHLHDGVAVVVTDLVMPGGVDGLDLLQQVRREAPQLPVIMVTGQGSEEAAVTALKRGAFHYLTKPANPDELANLVARALETSAMSREIAALHERLDQRRAFGGMIGASPPMVRLFEKIRMVADTRTTVLIEGESGTGKELVAEVLHSESGRREGPFLAINCAALPAAIVESELFGHAKGAFTGALERRVGKFQAAHGGTLLIDEVGEMPRPVQAKLLRALESRQVVPVGSNEPVPFDVRIVAATNRSLSEMVAEGEFREDLYYRLNVVYLRIPPLRERRGDIPLLARRFLLDLAETHGRAARELSPELLQALTRYTWPGNVRQLRNTIESMVVMSPRETLDLDDLPEPLRETLDLDAPTGPPPGTLADLERAAIVAALERNDGNRTLASQELGISVRTLQRRIKEFGL